MYNIFVTCNKQKIEKEGFFMNKKISRRRNLLIFVLAFLICALTACTPKLGESTREKAKRIQEERKEEKRKEKEAKEAQEMKEIWERDTEEIEKIYEERKQEIKNIYGDVPPIAGVAKVHMEVRYPEIVNEGKETKDNKVGISGVLYDKEKTAEKKYLCCNLNNCYKTAEFKVSVEDKINLLELKQMPVEEFLTKEGKWKKTKLKGDEERVIKVKIKESSVLKMKIRYQENKKEKVGYLMLYIEM